MSGLVLTLSSEAPVRLPLARCGVLQGAFYRLLAADEALAAAVHDKPHGREKQYKFFSFSDLHGHSHTEGKTLVLSGDVSWTLRFADERLAVAVRRTLATDPTVTLGEHRLTVTDVRAEDTAVTADAASWTADTPVLYYRTDESGFSTYFSPTDPAFCAGLERGAARKYAAFFGTEPPAVRITLAGEPRKCVTRYKHSTITGYYAAFSVAAAPSVLTFLYETGLGAKNSMGFGFVKNNS